MLARLQVLLVIASLLVSGMLTAAVTVEASMEPAEGAVRGQRMRLFVDVQTDSWFRAAPVFPELAIDGAVVLQPSGFATNFTERRGRQTWTVQRREYEIYPQRVGRFVVPVIQVLVKVAGDDGRALPEQGVGARSFEFDVAPVPATEATGEVIVAERVKVSASDRGQPAEVMTGEAIDRQIVIEATETLSMLIPPLAQPQVPQARVYRGEPLLEDFSNRGESRAVRTESFSVVFEEAGDYRLPAQTLSWWQPQEKRLRTIEIPPLDVVVTPNTALDLRHASIEQAEMQVASQDPRWLWVAIVVVSLVLLEWWLAPLRRSLRSLRDYRTRKARQARASEAYWFRRFLKACRQGDPQAVIRAAYQWLDRAGQAGQRMDVYASADEEFAGNWRHLQEVSFKPGDGRQADTRKLAGSARRRRGAAISGLGGQREGESALESLNPPA